MRGPVEVDKLVFALINPPCPRRPDTQHNPGLDPLWLAVDPLASE